LEFLILSQFDGPVNFNGEVRFNSPLTINASLRVNQNVRVDGQFRVEGETAFNNTADSSSITTGAVVIKGGVGIAKTVNIGGRLNVTKITTILDETESTTKDNGAFVVEGGVGIEKNLNVGGNTAITGSVTVTGTSTLGGLLTVNTGIVPDTDEGAYVGTAALPFSEAHIGEIRIADTTDNTIDTATGNLVLDAIGGTVSVTPNFTVTGTSTLGGLLTVNTGIVPDTDEGAYIGSSSLPFAEAHIGEIRIANDVNNNTIDTVTGNLILNSTGGTVSITDNLTVSNATTLNSTLTVAGTSTLNGTVSITGDFSVTRVGSSLEYGDGLELYRSGGAYIDFKRSTSQDYNVRLDNFDSGALKLTGALNVTGDITAFASDERLKTNVKPIRNALDKVFALSGFTYNFNDIGEKLGFSKEKTHVGVSAQQVQLVLPEAVVPCPADNNYLTVKYEKIVPLLIEAIKELKEEVDQLKRKLK